MALRYLKNVVTLELSAEKCNGCGICLEVCPHEVFAQTGRLVAIKDRDACMECGACAKNCPRGALRVRVGVGCANAILNAALNRKSSSCCCSDDCQD